MFEFITSWFKSEPISLEIKNEVTSLINENKVMVFSKSYCPYCNDTKNLLHSKTKDFKVIELDKILNGSVIQRYLGELTNQTTVPNIFIDGKHIGGNSDLQALNRSNQLVL